MALHRLLSSITALLFFVISCSAFSMTEYYNLDQGKAKKSAALRSESQHKTEVTIVNDTSKMIYYEEYKFTDWYGKPFYFNRPIFSNNSLLLYSDDEYDSVPIKIYGEDSKTVIFDEVVQNHTTLKASTFKTKC